MFKQISKLKKNTVQNFCKNNLSGSISVKATSSFPYFLITQHLRKWNSSRHNFKSYFFMHMHVRMY